MTLRVAVVFILLAAIIVPVILAELRRGRGRPTRPAQPVRPARAAKREAPAKPRLKLLVNKQDMDRELAALLAANRKSGEADE